MDITTEPTEENGRNHEGKFVKGNPGRPKGSRNKLGEAFIQDMFKAWKDQGPSVIQKVIDERPHDFLKVVAGILPKDFNLNINQYDGMSEQQLLERLKEITKQVQPLIELNPVDEERVN